MHRLLSITLILIAASAWAASQKITDPAVMSTLRPAVFRQSTSAIVRFLNASGNRQVACINKQGGFIIGPVCRTFNRYSTVFQGYSGVME